MQFLTEIHTHSDFSFDGEAKLADMLSAALKKGIAFYGVSEHFDYDLLISGNREGRAMIDERAYFHAARHLQEDYEGVMNVLVGAEFSYIDDENAHALYENTLQTHRPDFVVNSVHSAGGEDYYEQTPFYKTNEKGERALREKYEVYAEYFSLVRKSLDAPYAYDIVGHIGYAMRYAPYGDKNWHYAEYAEILDDILKTIVGKNKILELNTSGGRSILPAREIVERYFALGGRKISYASDAHHPSQIGANRVTAIALLKEIGFTHLTVPCRGEHIRVEI